MRAARGKPAGGAAALTTSDILPVAVSHDGRDLLRPNLQTREATTMNVRLTNDNDRHYSQRFSNFEVKVSRNDSRIKFSLQEKDSKARASFLFPNAKANQLGHAACTAAAADGVESIQFSVDDTITKVAGPMRVHLTYEGSGLEYCEYLSNFDVKVSRNGSRIYVSFRQKEGKGHVYAAFSLPIAKANQLGHALCTSAAADGAEPIRFSVGEASVKSLAA